MLLSLLTAFTGAVFLRPGAAVAQDTDHPYRIQLRYRSPGAFTLERGSIELAAVPPAELSATFTTSRSAWAWFQQSLDPELGPVRAAEYCETALMIDARFALAYNNLATLWYDAGRIVEAKRAWQIAVRLDPDLPSARANLALMYYLERKANRALRHLNAAFAQAPVIPALQNTLGLIRELEGNFDSAAVAYRIALKQDESYGPAWKNLARIYPEGGVDAAEALKALNRAITLEADPGEQAGLQAMAAELVGARAPKGSLGIAGTAKLSSTRLLGPPSAPAKPRTVQRGAQRRRGPGHRAPVRRAAATPAELEPDTLASRANPSASYAPPPDFAAPEPPRTARPAEVYEWYHKALASPRGSQERVGALYTALEMDPTFAGGYVTLGEALTDMDDHAAALDAFDTAVQLAPQRIDALEGQARSLRAVGRKDDALVAGKRWVAAATQDPQAYRFTGELLVESADYTAAESLLARATALAPQDPLVHYALGLLAYQRQDFAAAIEAYHATVSHDPTFAKGYHNLGIVLRRVNRLDEAVHAYRRAIELAPEWDVAYNSIGNLHRVMGDCVAALPAFEKAVELNPHNPHAYTNMGLCLEQLGDTAHALASYTRALEIAPGATWTRVARDRIAALELKGTE